LDRGWFAVQLIDPLIVLRQPLRFCVRTDTPHAQYFHCAFEIAVFRPPPDLTQWRSDRLSLESWSKVGHASQIQIVEFARMYQTLPPKPPSIDMLVQDGDTFDLALSTDPLTGTDPTTATRPSQLVLHRQGVAVRTIFTSLNYHLMLRLGKNVQVHFL
jgi:hypothetical protein